MNGPVDRTAQVERSMRMRMGCVALMLLGGFSVVVARAVHLHVSAQDNLQWIAKRQYQAVIPTSRRRAKVADAKGRELAVSVPITSMFADPSAVADPAATVNAINDVFPLGNERKEIVHRLRPGKKFAWIRRRVPVSAVEKLRALSLPGVHFVEESLRVYPNGELASQLLGAVGYDAEPLAGVELAYDKYLHSDGQDVVYQRDARGRVYFSPVSFGEQDDVGTMTLTIDKFIQYTAEQSLQRAVEAASAKGGVAIVVDVPTGKILAMANQPTFNPNDYSRYAQDTWRNRSVTDTIEPGSTFKVLVVSAALDAGMDPNRRFNCENGHIQIGSAVLHDHNPYGLLSVADIIKVSSNIGAFKVAQEIGRERVAKTLRDFGIGSRVGVGLPGEVAGTLRREDHWQPVEFATIAFGQGVSVTPLHMAMAFQAIANNGALMRPYVVQQIVGRDGKSVLNTEPQMVRQVIRPETAATMRALLRRVVEPGGTAIKADSPLYRVGGKTGTAQKVEEGHHGYGAGKFFASFVGMAPIESPRIVVYVGLDEPKGGHFGGVIAAPVFREVVEATLQYLEVPASGTPVILTDNHNAPLPTQIAVTNASEKKSIAKSVDVAPEIIDRAFVKSATGQVTVPNLTGLSMRQVIRLAGEVALPLQVKGAGVGIAQHPAPGQVLTAERSVEVEFAMPK